MGVGPSNAGLIAGGPVVTLRDLAANSANQEWVENAYLQAALRLAKSGSAQFDDVGALAFSEEDASASVKRLFASFFDQCDRTMLPVKKLLWLGLASSYPLEAPPAAELAVASFQVAAPQDDGAARPSDLRVFSELVRWASKDDDSVLCDLLLNHPALKGQAGEGARPVRVERFLKVEDEERKDKKEVNKDGEKAIDVKSAVMWALQSGSLKEVLMVTLGVLHLDSEYIDEQLSCMDVMSFIEMPQFVLDAQEAQKNRIVVEEEAKVGNVCAVCGCRPEVAKTALEIVGWQLDSAVMLLMDNPAKVEAALEKKVLEQEEREIAAITAREQRQEALKEVKTENLARQLCQFPCFSGTIVQSSEHIEGRQYALMCLFRHLDRLLVELECPLKLEDAPVERLIDGHVLSLAFIDALVGIFSGELLHDDISVPCYIVTLLLRLLKSNFSRFKPINEDDIQDEEEDPKFSSHFKLQREMLKGLSTRLINLMELDAKTEMVGLVRNTAIEAFKSGISSLCCSHESQARFLQRLLNGDPTVALVAPELFQYLKKDYVLEHFCRNTRAPNIMMVLEHVATNHCTDDVLDLLFQMQTLLLYRSGESAEIGSLALCYAETVISHCLEHYDYEFFLARKFLLPLLSGMCLMRTTTLLGSAQDLSARLLKLAAQPMKGDSESLSLSLANVTAYLLGKLASILVVGPKVKYADMLEQFPMFKNGSISTSSEAVPRAQKLAPCLLPTIQDLLKTRTGKEIDEMIILSAAALLHHHPEYGEREAFVCAVGLKLKAMRKLQLERTEGGIGVVCKSFSDRAALLLTFASCGSSDGLLSFIERGPDLDELTSALDGPNQLAQSRIKGFQLFRQVLSSVTTSVPRQHALKWVSFSLRNMVSDESKHCLLSLDTVDRATHALISSGFYDLFHDIVEIIKQARLDADDALCAIALSAWGVRFEVQDHPFLQQCGIITVLRDILSPASDAHHQKAVLKSSGTAYQFKVQQLAPDQSSRMLDEHQMSRTMAMQIMCLVVAQVTEAASVSSEIESEISQLLFAELKRCLERTTNSQQKDELKPPAKEEGESTQDCQQLISASRFLHRHGPGLTIPDLIRTSDGRANVCFSFWLMASVEGAGSSQTLFFLGESRAFWSLVLTADKFLQFHFCTEKKQLSLQSATPLPLQEWLHVAVSTRHKTVRMYVNGSVSGKTRTNTFVRSPGFFPLHLGTFYACPVGSLRQGLHGRVSDARFFSRIVSAEEIQKLHAGGPLISRDDETMYHVTCLLLVLLRKIPKNSTPLDLESSSLLLDALRFGTIRVQSIAAMALAELASILPGKTRILLRSFVAERLSGALSLVCKDQNVKQSEIRAQAGIELLDIADSMLKCDEELWAFFLSKCDPVVLHSMMCRASEAPSNACAALMDRFMTLLTDDAKTADDDKGKEEEEEETDDSRVAAVLQECTSRDQMCIALRAIASCNPPFSSHVSVLKEIIAISLDACISSASSLEDVEDKLFEHRSRIIDLQAMHKELQAPNPLPVTPEEEADSEEEQQDEDNVSTPPPPPKSQSPPGRESLRKSKYGRKKAALLLKKKEQQEKEPEGDDAGTEEGETEEQKQARLQEAVPVAMPNEVSLALVISGGDFDRGRLWLLDKIEKRQIVEIQSLTKGQFPKSWSKTALEKCSMDPVAAASWIKSNYLELVSSQPDEMMSFKGEDGVSSRYFPVEKSRKRRNGGSRPDLDNSLVPQDWDNETSKFMETSRKCATLSCRYLVLSLMGECDALLTKVLSPAKLIRILKLLLFRGFGEEPTREKVRRYLAAYAWSSAECVQAVIADCIFQLQRFPVEEYSSFMTEDERFIPDATVLWAPNLNLTMWILELLMESELVSLTEQQINDISSALAVALKCAHVTVKNRVFNLVSRWPKLLTAIPVDRVYGLLLARYERERRASHLVPHSRYMSTLVEMASKLDRQQATDHGTLLVPHVFAPEFAALPDQLLVTWFPLQQPKKTRSAVRYTLEMSSVQLQGESREWTEVYEGTDISARIVDLLPGHSYVFRLQASRGTTCSSWSEECFAFTMGAPVLLENTPETCAESCVVDASCRTASRPEGPNSWRCVTGQPTLMSGVHYWEVLVEQADWGAAFVGVAAPGRSNLTNTFGMAFANWRGLIGSSEKLYGEHFGTGSTVGILLDMDRRRVSFLKDGKFLGVAFADVKHDALIPTLGLKNRGTKLTIMSNGCYSRGGLPANLRVRKALAVLRQLASMDEAVPTSFLKLVYTEWKMWCQQSVKQYMTKPGFTVQIDIGDEACAQLSDFRHGDVIKSPTTNEDYRVLGVHGPALWYEPVDGGLAWNWSAEFFRDWASQFILVKKANHKPAVEDCQMPFHKFCKVFHATARNDDLLVQEINSACIMHECSVFNLSPAQLESVFSPHVAFLRVVNEYVSVLLPVVDFTTQSEVGQLLRSVKHLLFFETKRKFFNDLLDNTKTATRLKEDEYTDPYNLISIKINRKKASKYSNSEDPSKRIEASLFNQTWDKLSGCGSSVLRQHYSGILDAGQRRTFKVKFLNEGVTDNGGPYRELFSQICNELHTAELLPYLVRTPNGRADIGENRDLFLLNGRERNEQHWCFLGGLIGMAIRSQIPMELNLSQLVWKHIVGEPRTDEDLRGIDEVLHNMLCDMRDCDDEEKFKVMFEDVTWNVSMHDGSDTFALKGDGTEPVSFAERREFFKAALEYKLEQEGKEQLYWLLEGLSAIVPLPPLRIFSAAELELIICGEPFISIDLLKRMAVYEGTRAEEQHIVWLWQYLEELDQGQRAQFLQFVWARRRLPQSTDLTQLRFKIQQPPSSDEVNPDSRLPTASTCFFSIALPRYSSYEVLKSRVQYACQHCMAMDADFRLSERDVHLSGSL